MVDMIQCSDQILTVANYQNRESYIDLNSTSQPVTGSGTGTIVNTSSHGPTRDDRTKPSIGSPGLFCMVPATVEFIQWQWANEPFKVAEDSMHTRGAGTSVASPSIAGICALYLEKCPNASNVEVMNAVTGTAIQDANTGAVPNNTWGWGKADAFAALISSNFSLSLTTDALCCGGDSVLITAPAGYAIYDWNNGDTTQSIYVDVDGSYWATVTDSSGCVGSTDTASIVITSIPDPESIQASVYPNPATDELTFTVSEHGMYRIILASAVGSILSPTYSQWMVLNANEPMTIDIGHLAPGVYFFELFDQVNGSYHETIVVQ